MTGIILWAALCLAQIVYTVVCFHRKEKQPKVKHIIRFAAFGLLCILLALPVCEWGFRWAPLFFTLLLLAAISLVQIFAKNRGKAAKAGKAAKPFRRVGAVLAGIGGVALITTAALPAIIFPQYTLPAATGPYTVLTAGYTYVDEGRAETYADTGGSREVSAAFWYPDAGGSFPLIVFDHGFCGVENSNASMFMELASHGYVVCSVGHPYQSFYTRGSDGNVAIVDMGYMQEYMSLDESGSEEALEHNLALFRKWMDVRTHDINFVIDTILGGDGGVYGLVDHSKIGLVGHSLGGASVIGIPRGRDGIGAVVNLDAPMMSEITGVAGGAYTVNPEPYPAPLLNVYSQYLYDNGILVGDEAYFENRIVSATAPASFEVVFMGAQHMSLTDLSLVSPPLAYMLDGGRKADIDKHYCLETLNRIVLEFFDSYLKGEGGFASEGSY
ncbi:MAG: hypothetical protein FWG03_02540 [Clostridiales bacterium]|nr:hypothetical protein [Clostridiales bacterium]